MNKDLTWIVCVLDESQSMDSIKKSTIDSYNEFIDEQKKVPGMAECSLIKFNSRINKVYENVNIQNVSFISNDDYKPSTMTRLYDAVGFSIKETTSKIKKLEEDNKPSKVLFVIITDGQENMSRDFDKEEIFAKITKKEKKGWAFLFLGANQDAMKEGGKIGIKHTNTVKWEANDIGINTAFMSTSNYVSKYRNAKTTEELSDLDLTHEYENILNKEKKINI